MNEYEFKVGDRIYTSMDEIGTVVSITPTGRYNVEFDGCGKSQFLHSRREVGRDGYHMNLLYHLTEKDEQRIRRKRAIYNCSRLFERTVNKLSYDQAMRILKILEEVDA